MIITFKTTMHKYTKNSSNSQLFDRVQCSRINNISFGLAGWNTISLVLARLRTILRATAGTAKRVLAIVILAVCLSVYHDPVPRHPVPAPRQPANEIFSIKHRF